MRTKNQIDIGFSALQPEPTDMNSAFFVGILGPKSPIECDGHGNSFIFFDIRTDLLGAKPQSHTAIAWNHDAETISNCKRNDMITIAGSLRMDGPQMLEAVIAVETIVQVKPYRSIKDLIDSVSATANLVYLVGTMRRAQTTAHRDGHRVNVLSLSTGVLPDDSIKVVFNSCFDVQRSIPVGTLVAATGSLAHKNPHRKHGPVVASLIHADEIRVVDPEVPALAIRRLQVSLN